MRGQRYRVLSHLMRYGNLTSLEAVELYRCTRLAALIYDFRKMGYKIESVKERTKTWYGETCEYTRYVIAPEDRKPIE